MKIPLLLIDSDTAFAPLLQNELERGHTTGLEVRWEQAYSTDIITPVLLPSFQLILVGESAGGIAGVEIIAQSGKSAPIFRSSICPAKRILRQYAN